MNFKNENITIYLVDDDQELLDAFALYLGTLGYKTELFNNSESFLKVNNFS